MTRAGDSHSSEPWYARFFSSPDSLWLGAFPDEETSRWEAEQVARLVGLRGGMLVVDVPCGPGRHAIHWAAMGCRCVGVDLSATMLRLAQIRAAEAGAHVYLVRGRMERLPLASGVADVVVNLFNSFGYLDDAGDARVLYEAARVLKPGGRFLLDTRNPVIQILCAPYGEETTTADGRRFVARARYDVETKRLEVRWRQEDGQVQYEASIRLYSLDELRQMMSAAGLAAEAAFGDFSGEAFTGDQAQMIILARKAP